MQRQSKTERSRRADCCLQQAEHVIDCATFGCLHAFSCLFMYLRMKCCRWFGTTIGAPASIHFHTKLPQLSVKSRAIGQCGWVQIRGMQLVQRLGFRVAAQGRNPITGKAFQGFSFVSKHSASHSAHKVKPQSATSDVLLRLRSRFKRRQKIANNQCASTGNMFMIFVCFMNCFAYMFSYVLYFYICSECAFG